MRSPVYIPSTSEEKNKSLTHPLFFQPKLSINPINDIYEQEADAVADKVMRVKDSSSERRFFPPPIVQRKCADCGKEEKKMQRKENNNEPVEAASQIEKYLSSLSGGRSLTDGEKNFFEPRMGYDFSNVKIHTDSTANESAKNVNALAYTHSNDIVFASGQYQPGTDEGKKLLAHELTHTVQQTKMGSALVPAMRASLIQRSTDDCKVLADEHRIRNGTEDAPVCERPPEPNIVGSIAEKRIYDLFHFDNTGSKLTQVTIPSGNKNPRKNKDPIEGFGYADMLEFEDKGTHVEVKIAEIKPLSWKWLGVAASETADNYLAGVRDYGYMCAMDSSDLNLPANRDARAFCGALGLLNNPKEVRPALNPYINVRSVTVFDQELSPRALEIHDCGDGGIHYRCVSREEDKRPGETGSPLDAIVGCLLEGVAGEWIPNPGMCGMLLDAGLSFIPYVDQVADVRDFAAHLYYILYKGEYDNVGRWISVAFSLIGWIPEIGSAIKSTSKIGSKALKEGLEIVENNIIGRELRKIFTNENLDELLKLIQENKAAWKESGIAAFTSILNKMDGYFQKVKTVAEVLARIMGLSVVTVLRQLDDAITRIRTLKKTPPQLAESFDADFEMMIREIEQMKRELDEIPVTPPISVPAPGKRIPVAE